MLNFKQNVLAGLICMIFTYQAQAGSELLTLIKMLHENGTVDDAQFERLMEEIRQGHQEKISHKQELAQADEGSQVELTVDKGGLQLKSRDDEFLVKLGGRVQADVAWYDEDASEMGNGSEIRRARLYIQGIMFNDWGYKFQYDFVGSDEAGIRDAYLTYNGFDHFQLITGHFKDPFMLQAQTSSKYVTFTERALPDAFSAGRHLGIMASTAYQHWTAAAGFFGDSVSNSDNDNGEDEGWGVAGRVTYAPINEKTRVIHLGAAADYRGTGDNNSVQFKQQPETHVSGVNIVDTGKILNVDNYLKLGAEFAVVEGPFSLQSEYIWTTVDRESGADLGFDGWYVEAAYFITGESRNYKKGKFAGVSPRSIVGRKGFGAWQIATRYSTIDLNDHEIEGGQADSFTAGLNWFPTSTLRFSANYVKVLDVDGGEHEGENPSSVQVRGQWAF